ncbi:MAG: helix-turn-helix domain-containing protein [Desulfomonilaceae bacterium]
MNWAEIVDQLLYESEGTSLDFKRDQYPFERATDDEKSELLKDILAFSNAWRRTDAYILIGVKEVRGGKSTMIGVSNHLDDAKLQQFVNSKTQRPIVFSYHAAPVEGKNIGIIRIPVQDRPFFLKKNFGRLEKDKVYIRRGSSTTVAFPDEIADMGMSQAAVYNVPNLSVEFYNSEEMRPIGPIFEGQSVDLSAPSTDQIPDYGSLLTGGVLMNRHYYRDLAEYLQAHWRFARVDFCVTNNSHVLANDVRLRSDIECDEAIYFADARHMPVEPQPELVITPTHFIKVPDYDVQVQQSPTSWKIQALFGKIQPLDTSNTRNGLFVGARQPTELKLHVSLFADNLPTPVERELAIKIEVTERNIDLEELMTMLDQ